MNNDLISRKALLEAYDKAHQGPPGGARKLIEEAPGVDAVEVVHGRWEIDEEDIKWGNSLKKRYCTNCGKRPHFDKENREFILSDYCPNCGAKMDGEEK